MHHGKKDLERGQQFKHQLTKLFFERSRLSAGILYDNIFKEINSFKECYDQQELLKFSGHDQELAWMFFVDGCALIHVVKRYVLSGWIGFFSLKMGRDQVNLMLKDLILLDNQLPLGVLNLITMEDQYLRNLIPRFAKEIIERIHFNGFPKDKQAHIRTAVIVNTDSHMLELIWKNLVEKNTTGRTYNNKATFRQFRPVKDLQAAGVTVEPNNSSTSLRDIYFNRGICFGKLKIPSFHVSEERTFLVFNLIAFEMHPNFHKDWVVTSYISFLNSLMETKEDVAELRKAGILFNHLPNDEEVLKTFQELTSSLDPFPDIFSWTKEKLINYFNDKKRMTTGKWLSEAMNVHFRSPWTIIAIFSAAILLILTIIQTIFSVLAYQRRDTICDFIPEKVTNGNCSEWVASLSNAILNLRKNG